MCCFTQIWNIVKQVLCIDSPEGNTDYDEDEAVDIGAKDTLSYSWRTLKETRYASLPNIQAKLTSSIKLGNAVSSREPSIWNMSITCVA